MHTENDCTYTLISVPTQNKSMNIYRFIFPLNEDHIIEVIMNEDLSFLFSGKFLHHNQTSESIPDIKDDLFINLSSYGNNKLVTHMRNLCHININDKV